MKKYSSTILLLLFVILGSACERSESSYLAGPPTATQPKVAASESEIVDPGNVCNATLFTDKESCFRVAGGGLGTIDMRDILKTSYSFVRYEAYESTVAATGEVTMCFDLYEKVDPAATPIAVVCYEWANYTAVAVLTAPDGSLTLGYRKKL
jgi:hypothetical protein